ncbi:UNVERIFIED_CONTAM: hypothetical protein RMT77_011958 [Armadillidium vulgare]
MNSRKKLFSIFLLEKQVQCLLLCLAFILILSTTSVESKPSDLAVCLRNCALCKEMYGDHFRGKLCGKFCLEVSGKYIPDCGNKNSIAIFFLDRLE